MNKVLNVFFAGSVAACLAVTFIVGALSGCNANSGAAILGTREEYKIFNAMIPDAKIEQGLNDLAREGWKVRAVLGGGIILAR